MNAFSLSLLLLSPWVLLAIVVWALYFRNQQKVEPNNRERVVIQKVTTGEMDVLGPGTHFLGPEWKILERVDLNREPVSVSGDHAEEVKSSDGIRLKIEYRYDMVSGRPFDKKKGTLKVDPDNADKVTKEMVISAVTRIDYPKRKDRIGEIVKAALEEELGQYTADQLMTPGTTGTPVFNAPQSATPGGIAPKSITTTADLYTQLGKCVEERANRSLLHVGINIVDFKVTNLRFVGDELQKALENEKRMEKLAAAAEKAKRGDMTDREAFAVGTEHQGTVAVAQATTNAGQAFGRGLSEIGKGLGKMGK